MRFIPDKEVDLRKATDSFDSLHYATTLADIVRSAPHEHFTIGVFGEWGSGKSSIVRTAQGMLEEDRGRKYHFYTYDAWKYSKDSFRRTFLLNLAQSLGLQETELFRSFYESKTEPFPVTRTLKPGLLAFVLIVLLGIVAVPFFAGHTTNWSWTLQTSLMVVAIFLSYFTNMFREYVGTRQNPAIFSPEQFENCFDEILSKVLKKTSLPERLSRWFRGINANTNVDRLVIVLDNIDRCERGIAYQLLSDFKNFLGKPNVVFIIPVDDQALRSHVASLTKSDAEEADEFLRKIFNNTLKIKPYKTRDLYEFTEALSRDYGLRLKPNTIDVIAKEYATNPRRIIQFLNSLISEKDYMARRMSEEFVLENETQIALILIIREEWPALYTQLANAPYKIKNLEQVLALTGSNSLQQQIYLRKTHPHTAHVDDQVLKVIFTNQDQHPHISDEVIQALASRNVEKIKNFVGSVDGGGKYLADYVNDELGLAVGRDVISSLAAAFNEIIFLNSIYPLTESINKSIQGTLDNGDIVGKCLQNVDDAECLGLYLGALEAQRIFYLQDKLLDYLNKLVESDNDTEQKDPGMFTALWARTIRAVAKHCRAEHTLKLLRKPFYVVFRDEDFYIPKAGFSKENLSFLVGKEVLELVVQRYDHSDERHGEFIYLLQHLPQPVDVLDAWLTQFLEMNGNFGTLSKEDILTRLDLATEVLSNSKSATDSTLIQQLLDRIFSRRPINIPGQTPTKLSVIGQIGDNWEELETPLNLLAWAYVRVADREQVNQRLIEVASLGKPAKEKVVAKLAWLHDAHGFSLSPFHEFLADDADLSPELTAIYKWLLVAKDKDNQYSLEDDQARRITERCLDALVEAREADNLSDYFEVWVKDSRIREIISELVSVMDTERILAIPLFVQQTAYAHISQGDRIFQFGGDLAFMAAMNKQNNTGYNKQIEKVIINKLTKEETFGDGVALLENLESFSGMDTRAIASLLKDKAQDPELGQRISLLLEAKLKLTTSRKPRSARLAVKQEA